MIANLAFKALRGRCEDLTVTNLNRLTFRSNLKEVRVEITVTTAILKNRIVDGAVS